jgi:hypothetical protein
MSDHAVHRDPFIMEARVDVTGVSADDALDMMEAIDLIGTQVSPVNILDLDMLDWMLILFDERASILMQEYLVHTRIS